MNTEKTVKNSIISIVAEVMILLLRFIGRRVFIIFLDVEYLGYQSLFGNIFSILSVAELGIGGIISFHLYKELAEGNEEEIGKLMYLYKWIYRAIAGVVLIAGGACGALVPYIAKDAVAEPGYLYLIYYLQLASVVAGYFLSYRRTIYIANQREYKCVQVDLCGALFVQIGQIAMLAMFRDYIAYLLVQIMGNFLCNVAIAYKTNRDYPYLRARYRIARADIQRRNMFADVRNFLVHKISYAVYGGTDNIIISAFCGVRSVALYGNYFLLQQGVLQILFYKLLNPVQATLGNIIYSKRSREELWRQFEALDVFSFFFASYICIGFLVFFQPAIQIWMGEEYLLPFSFVACYSLTIYLLAVWEIVYKYRNAFGDYAKDRNCMMLSAVSNIVISVLCVRKWGVTGVQIGTLISFLPTSYGRIRFVVGGFFRESVKRYYGKHALLLGVVLIEGVAARLLTRGMAVSLGGIAARFGVWAVLPGACGLLIYWRNPHFKELGAYFGQAFGILRQKLSTRKSAGNEG